MTKISNQYSLTNILTADLANSRLGINNVSPAYSLDLTGTARVSTSAYFATASGSVGIGTTSPTFSAGGGLQIRGSGFTSMRVSSASYVGLDVSQINSSGDAYVYLRDNTNLIFGTNDAERMRITAAGNVGIGTTSVTADYDKSVILYGGNPSYIVQTNDNTGYGYFHIKTPSYDWSFGYDGANNFKISNGTHPASSTKFTIASSGAATFSSSVTIQSAGKLTVNRSDNTRYGEFYTDNLAVHLTSSSDPLRISSADRTEFYNAGSERIRITSAGNVGIGTTSPTGAAGLALVLNSGASQGRICIKTSATGDASGDGLQIGVSGTGAFIEQRENAELSFATNASEKMRITATGNVGIGTTSPDRDANTRSLAISGGLYAAASLELFGPSAYGGRNYIIFTGTPQSLIFYDLTASATRMTISSTGGIGAAGSTTNIYNPSDKRLKQNISTLTYGLDKVKALNPVKFNWADGFEPNEANKTLLGFIAQEVNEVIPEAIESFGGDINLNGELINNPLRVNEKFIIPVLVKAIQELSAENTSLINRIEALENK
jgi:hypothetical protein